MVTEYHYILSLSWNIAGAAAQSTFAGVYIPEGNPTRDAAYRRIYDITRKRMDIQMDNPTVLFFSLEPNVIL